MCGVAAATWVTSGLTKCVVRHRFVYVRNVLVGSAGAEDPPLQITATVKLAASKNIERMRNMA